MLCKWWRSTQHNGVFFGGFCVGVVVLLRLVGAAHIPLVPDEAYYWLWSRHLQWGYVDHPFMVAFWVRLGTTLWGDTAFGVRFAGLLSFGLANLFIFFAARQFFPSQTAVGSRAVWLLNGTLMASIGLIPMTPDVPLFMFLSMALWALAHALRSRGAWRWWALCGVSLGLAVDSKYTACLWGVGLVGYVLLSGGGLWRLVGPWLGGCCAGVMILPTLWWNAHHHWAGLLKQGGRALQWQPERAGQFLGELFIGQLALITPWIAGLCCIGLWRVRHSRASVLLWLSVPMMVIFFLHGMGDRVQANWVWVLYPPLILAGAGYGGRIKGAVMMGAVGSFIIYLQALTGLLPLPAHWDPIARLSAGWQRLAIEVATQARARGDSVVVVRDYALASILAFQKPDGIKIMGLDSRWAYLQGMPQISVQKALFIKDAHYAFAQTDMWRVERYKNRMPVRAYRLEIRQVPSGWQIR
ncbi:hypothetical protein BG621_06445 [Parasaccharibacter apium]|nr:hypothetical protein BG621_06445 [Parasaccharibacter apium]